MPIVAICILAALCAFAVIFFFYGYNTAFASPSKVRRKSRAEEMNPPINPAYGKYKKQIAALADVVRAEPYELVTLVTDDGLRLYARYYHMRDGAPLNIVFHGYRGNTVHDCAGGFQIGKDRGSNILLVVQRAHGESDGEVISFGIKERFDALAWVKYAVERFGAETQIFLTGVSMGASTVLMASDLDLPENVRGIVADCGYTSPAAILRNTARARHIPAFLAMPVLRLAAKWVGHFDLDEASAVESVKHTKIPILFIHGEEDTFVPYPMVFELYDACASEKMLLTVPGAGHGLSYTTATKRYNDVVNEFLDKYTK